MLLRKKLKMTVNLQLLKEKKRKKTIMVIVMLAVAVMLTRSPRITGLGTLISVAMSVWRRRWRRRRRRKSIKLAQSWCVSKCCLGCCCWPFKVPPTIGINTATNGSTSLTNCLHTHTHTQFFASRHYFRTVSSAQYLIESKCPINWSLVH